MTQTFVTSIFGHDQVGSVQGRQFPTKRGVKQGDAPSLLLLNVGLEHAMKKVVFSIADFVVVINIVNKRALRG